MDFVDEDYGWITGYSENTDQCFIVSTKDGGSTWSTQYLEYAWQDTGGWKDICFVDHEYGWAISAVTWYGEVVRTTDGGVTWSRQPMFYGSKIHSLEFIDRNHGWAVGENGAIYRTTDGGANWETLQWIFDAPLAYTDVEFIDENNGWIVGQQRLLGGWNSWAVILHTTDGGLTWVPQDDYHEDMHEGLGEVQFLDANHGWVAGTFVAKTADGGATWEPLDEGPIGWQYGSQICFLDKYLGWCTTGDTVYRTEDSGITWESEEVSPAPVGSWATPDIEVIDKDHGWLLTGNDIYDYHKRPVVISTTPEDGAVDVAVSSSISAIFSEDMDASTINSTNFYVKDSDGEKVSGMPGYDATSKTATLKPDAPLKYSETYSGVILDQVADLEGNTMESNHVWTFTTEPVPQGNCCEAIKQLQIDLASTNAKVAELTTGLANANDKMTTLEQQCADHEARISLLEKAVAVLEANVNKMLGYFSKFPKNLKKIIGY